MKETTVTRIDFEKGDLDLLKRPLPQNPCSNCQSRLDGSCCGCPESREYEALVKPYRDAGVYDLASKMKQIKALIIESNRIAGLYTALTKDLPDEIREIL